MRDFHYLTYGQEIIFGRDALMRLDEALQHSGIQSLMLCADDSDRAKEHARLAEERLADRLAVRSPRVGVRVMDEQIAELVDLAASNDVDGVVGLGGPEAIDTAKAIAFRLEEMRTGGGEDAPSPTTQALIPAIAIPTTYAGTEMTPFFVVTRGEQSGTRRVITYSPEIAPKLVVYDTALTLDMPPEVTASSGVRALAHCFEALYSITRHPLSTAAALQGIKKISASLPACFRRGDDMDARAEMLEGAHLAGLAFSDVAMGLNHQLCHVLGEVDGIPLGIADAIILPYVIRFNGDTAVVDLLPAAQMMGIPTDGRQPASSVAAIAERIALLAQEMQLPGRLRDAGVEQAQLRELAERVFEDPMLQNNPRAISDPGQIEELLNEAW